MKKKGLIISTIVMVVVLIASLTTATYAWFTTTNATTVDSIAVKAAAGADVKVGMARSNAYVAGASQDAFVSGGLSWDKDGGQNKWTGDDGMGFELSTGLALNSIAKATGYGSAYADGETYVANAQGTYYQLTSDSSYTTTEPTEETKENYTLCETANTPYTGLAVGDPIKYVKGTPGVANKFNPSTSSGGTIVKASGTTSTVYDPTSVDQAEENKDYLHFVMAVSPSKTGIKSITISLFVNPGTNKNALGVEAALYCYYKKDAGSWEGGEIYDNYTPQGGSQTTITYNTTKSNIQAASTIGAALNALHIVETYTDSTTLNAGWREIDVTFSENAGLTVDQVYQVEFYIFYDGTDADCINSALGSECGILFSITNEVVA